MHDFLSSPKITFDPVFGWDSKYFSTIKKLIVSPEVILQSYIEGTRKKYARPFLFLAINTAITVIFLNVFSSQYLELNRAVGQSQFNFTESFSNSSSEKSSKELEKQKKRVMHCITLLNI